MNHSLPKKKNTKIQVKKVILRIQEIYIRMEIDEFIHQIKHFNENPKRYFY